MVPLLPADGNGDGDADDELLSERDGGGEKGMFVSEVEDDGDPTIALFPSKIIQIISIALTIARKKLTVCTKSKQPRFISDTHHPSNINCTHQMTCPFAHCTHFTKWFTKERYVVECSMRKCHEIVERKI